MQRSNRWRLHPWLPIDIRLPAAVGCLGMGVYLYLEQTGRVDEAQRRFQDAVRTADSGLKSISSTLSSYKLPSMQQKRPKESNTAPPEKQQEEDDTSHISQQPEAPPNIRFNDEGLLIPIMTPPEDETVTTTEIKQIDNLMQEALLGKEIVPPSEDNVPETDEDKTWAAVQALVSNLELSGKKDLPQLLRPTQEIKIEEKIPVGEVQGTQAMDVVLQTSSVMGITENVSASALLLHARRIGLGPASAYRDAALQQAIADTKTLQSALEQIAQHHAEKLAQVHGAIEHWKEQAEQSRLIAEEVRRGISSILTEQQESLKQEMKDSLKSKSQEITERLTVEMKSEIKDFYDQISKVAMGMRKLYNALDDRKREVEQFKMSYALSGATSSVSNALVQGCSKEGILGALEALKSEDQVVSAAKGSLGVCDCDRVSALKELQSRWPAVRRNVQVKASLHSESSPGILSTGLARMVSSLKFSEWAALKVGERGHPGRSLNVHLAAIDEALKVGKLCDAAILLEELEKFESVGHVAEEFTAAVRMRVLAEQALQLLHAHSLALTMLSNSSG